MSTKRIKVTLGITPPTTTQKNTIKFNRRTGTTYHTKQFTEARALIQNALLEEKQKVGITEPLDGNLRLDVEVYFERPKSHKGERFCNVKPDGDNTLAVIADQLEKTGYVVNDARFVIETITKKWADEKGARIEITITDLYYTERKMVKRKARKFRQEALLC